MCRSRSLSGTGRTPCADSGGRMGGAPTQDSPANPWDCGLVRDHSLNQSCGIREETENIIKLNSAICFAATSLMWLTVTKDLWRSPKHPYTSQAVYLPVVFLVLREEVEEREMWQTLQLWLRCAVRLAECRRATLRITLYWQVMFYSELCLSE